MDQASATAESREPHDLPADGRTEISDPLTVLAGGTNLLGSVDEQALLQASRVLEQIRSRYVDLERREQALRAQLAVLDQERRLIRQREQELADNLRERERTVAEREQQLQTELAAWEERQAEFQHAREESTRLAAELAGQRDSLAEDRQRLDQEREELAIRRREIEAQESKTAREQADWQERQLREIEQHTARLDAMRAEVLAELEQRQIDIEKRTHFHEAHLGRLREEFEDAYRRREQELQVRQQQHVLTAEILRMRLRQMTRFRETLDARERSVELFRQEAEWTDRTRKTDLDRRQERLDEERTEWMRHLREQQELIARRQHSLRELSTTLETRLSRFEQQRQEVGQTHTRTLELRTAIAEIWKQVAALADADKIQTLVEQARNELQVAYQSEQQRLTAQLTELAEQSRRLATRRDELRGEREQALRLIAGREQELSRREQQLGRQRRQLAEREQQWRTVLDHWQIERRRAEQVIQNLLEQLQHVTRHETQREETPDRSSSAA